MLYFFAPWECQKPGQTHSSMLCNQFSATRKATIFSHHLTNYSHLHSHSILDVIILKIGNKT